MKTSLGKNLLKIYTAVFFVALFLVYGFIALVVPSTSTAFYKNAFNENNTLYKVKSQARFLEGNAKTYIENLDSDGLVFLMQRTMRYCLYFENDLNPTVNGERLEVFLEDDQVTSYGTENEYKHMAEVKVVFGNGLILVLASAVIVGVGIFLFIKFKEETKENMKKIPFITLAVVGLILIAIGVVCLIDFDFAFTEFHHIFFPNGNWSFSRGVMITLIGDIFTGLVPWIALIWILLLALTITALIIYNKKNKARH